ncbi:MULTISPECIES: DUF4012 domain-containing protein [Bifidobacterium]|nr:MULTISPECIES: DUF4012 domain-containing protein [Bifidobacterium]
MPKRVALSVVMVFLGFILAVAGVYGVSALKMYHEANRMMTAAENLANAALGCGGKSSISDSSKELVDSTRNLRDELDTPKWTFVRDHTSYGNDITAARTMLDSMGTLVNGPFSDLMNLSDRLSGFSMDGDNKTVDATALMDMPKIFAKAHKDIASEVKNLQSVPTPKIGKVAQAVSMETTALQSVDKILNEYQDMADTMPELLGEGQARTYLVLVYNPAEIRSAGGMVGTVAEVTADNGKVTIGDFNSTIDYDHNVEAFDEANKQEARMFGTQIYAYAQMTTQNPDYTRVAVTNMNLWKKQKGNANKNVAGVIAIDPVFLQSMLGATGSVKLSGGKTLDGTSTVKFFLKDLYLEHPKFEEQNKYVNDASKQIMSHVFSNINTSTASGMLKAVRDTSSNGHFKLWMKDNAEQKALVQTGIINEAASGKLSEDKTTPESGVWLNEYQASKLSWYLKTTTTVKKTCDLNNLASNSDRLSDKLKSSPVATGSDEIDDSTMGDEYTVTFTMKNTLTDAQVKSLPKFVTGSKIPGGMELKMYLTAPYGGEITSVAVDDADMQGNMTIDNRQMIGLRFNTLEAGEENTVSYTVRVPRESKKALNVVTTPVINDDGISTGSGGKVENTCAASNQSQSSGSESQQGGSASSSSSASAGSETSSGKSSSSASSGASGSGTASNSTSNTAADDPLGSINDLKSRLTCPIDIKSIALG